MQLRHVFSELRQGPRRNPTMHIAVVLTLFVSLTLVGLGVLLNTEAKKTEEQFGSLNQITVFMCNKQIQGQNCSGKVTDRSEEHTSELQSLMRISYAVFCLKKKTTILTTTTHIHHQIKH